MPGQNGKISSRKITLNPDHHSQALHNPPSLTNGSEHFDGSGHIQPGKPQQNAYVERYNRTVRQEWLGQHIFATIEEARDHATRWLWTYNNERPNMANGGLTPAQKLKNAA